MLSFDLGKKIASLGILVLFIASVMYFLQGLSDSDLFMLIVTITALVAGGIVCIGFFVMFLDERDLTWLLASVIGGLYALSSAFSILITIINYDPYYSNYSYSGIGSISGTISLLALLISIKLLHQDNMLFGILSGLISLYHLFFFISNDLGSYLMNYILIPTIVWIGSYISILALAVCCFKLTQSDNAAKNTN